MALRASNAVGMSARHDMELALLEAGVRHGLRQRRIDVADQEIDFVALDQLQGFLNRGGGIATGRIFDQKLDLAAENSSLGINLLDGKLRAAYLLEMGKVYAKPMVDGDVMYLYMPGFSEYGAGALNLNVNGMSDVLFSATPALELGVTAIDGGDHVLRPRVSVGATFFSKNSLSVDANLAGAPAGSVPFVIVNGKITLGGAQQPEAFLEAFGRASGSD